MWGEVFHQLILCLNFLSLGIPDYLNLGTHNQETSSFLVQTTVSVSPEGFRSPLWLCESMECHFCQASGGRQGRGKLTLSLHVSPVMGPSGVEAE